MTNKPTMRDTPPVSDPVEASQSQDNVTANQQIELLESMTANMLFRNSMFEKLLDPRRDIAGECGYIHTDQLTAEKYRDYYDRDPIAARVVEIFPEECWGLVPTIEETPEESKSEFEKAWETLSTNLRGKSWFKGNEGNPIWEHLQLADKLSGVGHFGVLLLGVDDGKPLNEPIDGFENVDPEQEYLNSGQSRVTDIVSSPGPTQEVPKQTRTLIYLRAFDESSIEIERFDTDMNSPRYGAPLSYSITMNDIQTSSAVGTGADVTTSTVHWSRIIHIADNIRSSEIFGTPRMQVVVNRLMDLYKAYGGGAEGLWQAASPILTFSTEKGVKIDQDSVRNAVGNLHNSLQKYLSLSGMNIDTLAPNVSDPTSLVNTLIEAICIFLGCPKRIFMGTERGELSSAQDKSAWDERLIARRNKQITPKIIIPFIDRLIQIGVLPEPGDKGYQVTWPDLDDRSKQEKVNYANSITDAMVKYISGGLQDFINPLDWLTKILGMDLDTAKDILASVSLDFEKEDGTAKPTNKIPDNSEKKSTKSKGKSNV